MADLATLLEAWEPVIGLEVHVQLATESKAFSPSGTTFGAEPNSLTDPTVLALPGALPTFNVKALELALRLGVATGSKIRARCRFARKHYFYPDLPKGYQISQYDEPLCEDGTIELWVANQRRKVRLQRIHLEEDAGKNTHHGTTSLVDLNRAGVPLCEVVTLPDLHSAEEAAEYMRALHRLVRYLGVSEGDMEKGQMRCDANVSVRRRGEDRLGTRTELKNINSFRFVQKAIEHEIARQIRLLEEGGAVERETRLWDADAGTSAPMRSKEEIADYRYFPDPDLPPLAVDGATMRQVITSMPELPVPKLERFVREYGLTFDDAATLTDERELAEYLDAAVRSAGDGALARPLASFILTELLRVLGGRPITEAPVTPEALAELIGLVASDVISGKIAKDVFATMCKTGERAGFIVQRDDLRQISDASVLRPLCEKIIADNPKQVAQYRGGKDSLLGFFVGQLMKATEGKANPSLSADLMKKLLAG
ncbi:MAG: Asp-tRNA(Asn)/Glu-tRNA(Gln) amidotransferase subunit GatB [Deltaproteobacteria bacterium]|nr:Asp-tRNA(Asn)/Glu-tRNA(Gln) amidotransferase subunit GatB [Kofleriaceae bacterium]